MLFIALAISLLLSAHWPGSAQYCAFVQHMNPHLTSPKAWSQINDEVGYAMREVCTSVGVFPVDSAREEIDKGGASDTDGILALLSRKNLLGEALQQLVPPLSSGLFASQQ